SCETRVELRQGTMPSSGGRVSEKLVSIVLPVYNGASLLAKSIQSCLEQSYRNIELIVVDDKSTDNSVEVVKSFSDSRVKLVCHETNRRIPAALNTGFANSSGQYLTWTSHDNYYAPTAMQEMVSFLEMQPHISFLFANQYDVNEAGEIIGEVKPAFEKLMDGCHASGIFLYRREVYEQIGVYDERLPFAQDYEYWLRAYARFQFAHLDRFLFYNLVHPGSCTNRFRPRVLEDELAAKRKIFGDAPSNRKRLYDAYMDAVPRFLDMDDRSAAARGIARSI